MEQLQAFKKTADEKLAKWPQLQQLAQQSGVEASYLALGVVGFVVLMLYMLGGGRLVVNLTGFAYPAYASFKAIESESKEDDKQWLTYWVVFAGFNLVETATDIFMSWIPFYFFLKLAFLIWSFHPATQGSVVVYNEVITKFIVPHLGLSGAPEKKTE